MFTELTPELLSSIAGIILSLLFSYVPGLNAKFAGLDAVYKRLVMLGLLLATALGIFGLACVQLISAVTCDQAGAWGLLGLFVSAAIANQAAYMLSPESRAVAQVKLEQALNASPHGQG